MKINSLDHFQPCITEAIALVSTSASIPSLPPGIDGFSFFYDSDQLLEHTRASLTSESNTPLVLIDSSSDAALRLATKWIEESFGQCEFWTPRRNVSTLVQLLEKAKGLAIDAIAMDASWVFVRLAQPNIDSLPDTAFRIGLQAAKTPDTPVLPNNVSAFKFSLAQMVISSLIPLVKPIKKYIPHQIVIVLYKLLEKIR